MSTTLLFILSILFAVVAVALFTAVHRYIAYYLPPVSIAMLAQEIKQNAAMSSAMALKMREQVEQLSTLLVDLDRVHSVSLSAHEAMLSTVLSSSKSLVNQYSVEVFDSVIRNASNQLANRLELDLLDRTTKVAGEYVLLQSLDDLELEISLDARYTSPEDIRTALVNIVKWNPIKKRAPKNDQELAQWIYDMTDNRRKLDHILGEVGEELFRLQWEGKLAMKVDRKNHGSQSTASAKAPLPITG